MKFSCAQRGCVFDAKKAPKNCPTCKHPFVKNTLPTAKKKAAKKVARKKAA